MSRDPIFRYVDNYDNWTCKAEDVEKLEDNYAELEQQLAELQEKKVTFEVTDPEEIITLLRAGDFQSTLCDIGNELRSAVRHGTRTAMKLQSAYDRYSEILGSHGLDRDDVGF